MEKQELALGEKEVGRVGHTKGFVDTLTGDRDVIHSSQD